MTSLAVKGFTMTWVRLNNSQDKRLFTLDVCLFDGPISEKFLKKNKIVSRIIEIRGSQTLEELHDCIFDAFDRFDGHMYEFQFGGKGPDDPKAKRYVLPSLEEKNTAGDLTRTTIGELGLKVDDVFGYLFDYGDSWHHQINVSAIADTTPKGKYPRVTKRVGKSPPQYMEEDD
jgi:hypothetical protein